MECTGDSGQVRVHVRARTNVRVFEQNLLTRAVESTRGHLDELSVQYVLRVLYILALRAPSRVLFSFHSTRPHPFFFFSSDIFIYSGGVVQPHRVHETSLEDAVQLVATKKETNKSNQIKRDWLTTTTRLLVYLPLF